MPPPDLVASLPRPHAFEPVSSPKSSASPSSCTPARSAGVIVSAAAWARSNACGLAAPDGGWALAIPLIATPPLA